MSEQPIGGETGPVEDNEQPTKPEATGAGVSPPVSPESEPTVESLTKQLQSVRNDLAMAEHMAAERIRALIDEANTEQSNCMYAQRGLVVYVRSLEEFNRRFKEYVAMWADQPKLRRALESLEGDLRELGLWNVRLGYDPDKDLSRSVVSPARMRRHQA